MFQAQRNGASHVHGAGAEAEERPATLRVLVSPPAPLQLPSVTFEPTASAHSREMKDAGKIFLEDPIGLYNSSLFG